MIKRLMLTVSLMALFSSCQAYKTGFDCPPKSGIPCKSVSEIEKMIVETERGPDLLVEREDKYEIIHCNQETKSLCKDEERKRVWMASQTNESGDCVEAHYIYFIKKGE